MCFILLNAGNEIKLGMRPSLKDKFLILSFVHRMNKYVKGPGRINTSAQDSSLAKRPFVVTPRPIQAKKRGFFEDQTSLIAGSYSSTSSYGSLNDEEIFTRHPES